MTQATYEARLKEHGSPFSMMDEEMLLALVNNPELAAFALSQELASRGKDTEGRWVGFQAAKKQHEARTK